MLKRKLGNTDLSVSEIAFGGVEIGMPYGIGVRGERDMLSDKEAIDLLHAAIEMGVNFFDTARMYGNSETIMGEAFRDRRKDVIIATKCPASIIGVIAGGYLTDRWGRRNPDAVILVPVIGLAIAVPSIYIASTTPVLFVAITLFMVYGFTRMFSDANIMPILCLTVDDRYRATGYGILNLFACIVGGLGLYAGGVLRDRQIFPNRRMIRISGAILFHVL